MRTAPLAATVVRIGIVAPSRGHTPRSIHLGVTLGSVLDEVFDQVPVPYRTPSWYRRPDGDATTIVIPPAIPKSWVAGDLVGLLGQALRRRNRHLNDYGRLRLRVAIDHGDVVLRPPQVGGAAIVRSAWLCEAEQLKAALIAEPDSDQLLIVSDTFYADVVAEGDRALDPQSFRQVVVPAGGGLEIGWLRAGPDSGTGNTVGNGKLAPG